MDNHIYFQALKKNNDDCRRIHLNKSNKWDAPADVLLGLSKRIERLSRHQRTPQGHTTRETQSTGIVILIKGGQRRNAFK